MYRLISETTQKARKQHTCMCCLKPIEIGTVYHREKSIYDGLQTFKMHIDCRKFFDKFISNNYGEEFSEWELNEAWEIAHDKDSE